jgi:predicted phage gp36 major capsid-like protein
MLYADFSRYYVVRKHGFSVEFIPNVVDGAGQSTGERGFLGWWRVGAGSADTNSGRTLRI